MDNMVEKKKYKVMAYILSTGIWDAFGAITLEKVLGREDPELSDALKEWQAAYDDQFKTYPYDFDWEKFNRLGEQLTSSIQSKMPADAEVYYEPSDDREFFSPEDCHPARRATSDVKTREQELRERKRALLYAHIAGGI